MMLETMDDLNCHLNGLHDDIMQQLKYINLNNLLSPRILLNNSFVYCGNKAKLVSFICFVYDIFPFLDYYENIHTSSSFTVLRQALEPYNQITKDICSLCHWFNLNNSTICYSIELFDSFFSNLISYANKHKLLFSKTSALDLSISPDFGNKILNIANLNCCFDYLYWLLFDNHLNYKTRDLYAHNYARTICITTCVFISAKLHNRQSYPRVSQLIRMLESFNIPSDLCQTKIICSMEKKILNLIKFNLNLTTLDIYVETILSFTTRLMLYYKHINKQIESRLSDLSILLTQNYYISRLSFLIQLFEQETGQVFNIQKLDHIEYLENLSREKMLIASGIVVAVCQFSTNLISPDLLCKLIGKITTMHYTRIKYCRNVFLNYILDEL